MSLSAAFPGGVSGFEGMLGSRKAIEVVPPSPTALDTLTVIKLFLEKLELLTGDERAEIFNVIHTLNHPLIMIPEGRLEK